jgi:hypothetical protein
VWKQIVKQEVKIKDLSLIDEHWVKNLKEVLNESKNLSDLEFTEKFG